MSRGKAKGDEHVEKVVGKLRRLLLYVINKVVLSHRRKRIDPLGVLERRNIEYHVEFRGYRVIFNGSNNFHSFYFAINQETYRFLSPFADFARTFIGDDNRSFVLDISIAGLTLNVIISSYVNF